MMMSHRSRPRAAAHLFSRREALALGLGGALACAITAPSAAAEAGDWESVVAAAKKEGRLTVYNGTNFPVVRKIAEEFEKKYGIATRVLDGRASEINERIRTEQSAGRNIGDVAFGGMTSLSVHEAQGFLQSHGPLPNSANVAAPLTDDGTITPACVGNFAIMVNNRLVRPGEITSWKDLTDPKWKGKILSDDPRAAGAGEGWFEVTYNHFGRGFHEKMAAQRPVFSRVFAESERRVARGEYPIYLPFNISQTPKLKGLPVNPVIPAEGVPYVAFEAAMLKRAPHPDASRLFVNYLLDVEPQTMLAEQGFRPAAKGMAEHVPADLRPFTVDAKLLGTMTPGVQDKFMAIAKTIYK
jgi:iron(III) transport system substrate-binding protein